MDRLQKKCLIVSAGIHLLLMGILLVGPAFVPSKPPLPDTPILDFIPDKLVDGNVSGGGNPNARRAAPTPELPKPEPAVQTPKPAPQPDPLPPKRADPEPPKEVVKNNTPDPDAVEAPRKRMPKVSTDPVLRKPSATPKAKTSDAAAREHEQLMAQNRRIAESIKGAASSIRQGTASATTIEDSYGPGGGGPTYASYVAWVKTVYENAWRPPEETAMDDAIVKASITIARDGTILAARITIPCGDARVDRSVRDVLDRVKTIGRPFPEGAKEAERTYTISFNVKARRGLA